MAISGVSRASLIECLEIELKPGAARERDQMHDRVGRAADRQHRGDGVLDRIAADHVGGFEVVPDHVDDALAGHHRHHRMAGIGGRNRGGAGQRHSERLGGAGHGRGGAHGHAMAGRAGDALLDLLPILSGDGAGAQLDPVFPHVAARAQRGAAPGAAQHRASGHEDRRQIHRDCAHQQRRRGLVATAHQHRAVGGVGAQRLLGLHRQEVAIHHRRWLLERLGERHRRQFDREASRLPHAALHLLHPLLEMGVAGVDVAPGVDDRDHRLSRVIGALIAHLRGARAMAERAQIVDAVPAMTAKVFRSLARHGLWSFPRLAGIHLTSGSAR